VVVAFLFLDWFIQPESRQPEWIRNARSKVVLKSVGEWLKSMLPDDPEGLYQKLKKRRDDQQQQDQEPPAGKKTESVFPVRLAQIAKDHLPGASA
jgi:membrane protein required for colicin V production